MRPRVVWAGSIPARAGEPQCCPQGGQQDRVYPRACGGTADVWRVGVKYQGLSPRVRGNQRGSGARRGRLGSIPARAGEPPVPLPPGRPAGVYPRACGGTVSGAARAVYAWGLSPRVRGNRGVGLEHHPRLGSIPARAGEPFQPSSMPCSIRVYPRACGGTTDERDAAEDFRGLSPRVRGNPPSTDCASGQSGSIPARAGEPTEWKPTTGVNGVYPRACGGTALWRCSRVCLPGLSPRVRGNPVVQTPVHPSVGSIPARAGEPRSFAMQRSLAWVYPRACGGTASGHPPPPEAEGLSPRVRGNPRAATEPDSRYRSIPARAGEPRFSRSASTASRVYPRACGGTSMSSKTSRSGRGLSPRVRGNLSRAPARAAARGSIPARAGEPGVLENLPWLTRVYPRACGGTVIRADRGRGPLGLSPRVRGNLIRRRGRGDRGGSIPARAGEPGA